MPEATIPVLNLGHYLGNDAELKERFIQNVGEALRDIGFFALQNHGIPMDLTQRGYALAQEFFRLPEPLKKNYHIKGLMGQRGYVPFGAEKAKDATVFDLKEFWHVGQPNTAGTDYAENIWPTEISGFKETFAQLYAAMEGAARSILECCALFIGEPVDSVADMMTQGNSILRLLHYPSIPDSAPENAVRAAAHEDINLITFLIAATASGLEIKKRDGTWMPVVTPPGCIIVDSGDMLCNLTNGYFCSTTHRVVNPVNSREDRFSMPFFVHPRSECSLNPLNRCIMKTGGVQKFPNLTAGEYLGERLRELGLVRY